MPSTKTRPTRTVASPFEAFAFETPLGWIAIAAADNKLQRVLFGRTSFQRLARESETKTWEFVDQASDLGDWADDLVDRLQDFASGEPVDFTDVPIDTSYLTPFGQQVIKACRKLAWGQTATYADLAKRARRPGAARAVGSVMAKNRYPLVVPCHRVVGSGGCLGGYSAPGGLDTKRQLLDLES